MRAKIIGLMGLMGLIVCGCGPQSPSAPVRVKWDYKTFVIENANPDLHVSVSDAGWMEKSEHEKIATAYLPIFDHELTEIGSEGWEMVSCVPQIETVWAVGQKLPNTRTAKLTFIFKRPR